MTENLTDEIKQIIQNKLECKYIKKIGSGSFGSVYKISNKNNDILALKIEDSTKSNHLQREMELYNNFKKVKGIPSIFWYGTINKKNILAIEYLGSDLDTLFEYCKNKFSLKTTLMIAIQMLDRIETIHEKNIIHRDLKPDNFLIGNNSKKDIIYVIDFGLSKKYLSDEVNHINYSKNKSFTGSLRYASIRNHKGIEQSRRDDLESIGYILIYFLKGKLPWQGLNTKDKNKRAEEIFNIKRNTSLEDLCSGIPEEFLTYMKYCRLLQFKAQPNYQYLKNLFFNLFVKNNIKYNYEFDWTIQSNK